MAGGEQSIIICGIGIRQSKEQSRVYNQVWPDPGRNQLRTTVSQANVLVGRTDIRSSNILGEAPEPQNFTDWYVLCIWNRYSRKFCSLFGPHFDGSADFSM
jgi:hypothetical protein